MEQKDYRLPDTVYRQVLWAMRDLPRMREKAENLRETLDTLPVQNPGIPVGGRLSVSDSTTSRKAVEMACLDERILALETAFEKIPTKYREGIRAYLTQNCPYPENFHRNTWKKWQQIVLYFAACHLHIL